MWILFSLSFLGESFFSSLSDLFERADAQLFSPKDYLVLESKYHPSRLLRYFFQYLLTKWHHGQTLRELVRPLGLAMVDSADPISQLKYLFQGLGRAHPLAYPWGSLFRLSIVFIFQYGLSQKHNIWDISTAVFLLSIAFILREQVIWHSYKVQLIKLSYWILDPERDRKIIEGQIYPVIIQTQWDRTLWQHIVSGSHPYEHACHLYYAYWKNHHSRKIRMHRQSFIVSLNFLTFVMFLSFITPLMAGFYQGQFLL